MSQTGHRTNDLSVKAGVVPQRALVCATAALMTGCNGAPSRNILGSYFPSWMVCALVGIAVAAAARGFFKYLGILDEIPIPFVVFLAICCTATFGLWLTWLA
jgi:YtcA family